MIAAAAVCLLAAIVIGGANPVAAWWAKSNPDRLLAEVQDDRDFDANVRAFDAMGATR